jgi:hypothetical protein
MRNKRKLEENRMKKNALIISLVIFLVSCQNDVMENVKPNPFIGTWENERLYYTFTETWLTITLKEEGNPVTANGPYIYDDIHIVLRGEITYIYHYILEDDVLFVGDIHPEQLKKVSP